MSLIEKLALWAERKNVVDLIKKETDPLVLWGAGSVAELAADYLEENAISIDGVFEWPERFKSSFRGMGVLALDEVEKYNSKYNIFVGHSHYSMVDMLRKYASNLNHIFYMPSIGYNCICFDKEIIMDMIDSYEEVYRLIADDCSRRNLAAFLNTKLTGDVQYIFDVFKEESKIFSNDIYQVSKQECFWNIGAACGETIREFITIVNGEYKQIIGMEPDYDSYIQFVKYIATLDSRVLGYYKAAWDESKIIRFNLEDNIHTHMGSVQIEVNGNGIEVEGIMLDDLLKEDKAILPPTLISANYFYGITEMLNGSKNIINKYIPKLAITVGHNDEYGIPRVIDTITKIDSRYKIYLRYNQALATTLVLYAVADI